MNTQAQCLNSSLGGTEGCQQDHLGLRGDLVDHLHNLQAIHAWHPQINHHQFNRVCAHILHRGLTVWDGVHSVAFQTQNLRQ
jgi:hypothetical protein